MIIQFTDLTSAKKRNKEINVTYDLTPINFGGEEIKTKEAIKVVGNINSTDDILTIKASVKTVLELKCSRCLDTFIYPIDIDIEERFTNNDEYRESEEVVFVDSDTLDIAQVVESQIVSTLPIKRLCKDDCNGLCQQCGNNLNQDACQCMTNNVDLRLAKLQELFGNKEV